MSNSFQQMLERAKTRDAFWVETAILEVTEEIVARMEELSVTKTELAKRLGRNQSFVTKLLKGTNNFTLETLVKVSRRLDCRFRSHLQPDGSTSEWINFLHAKPPTVVTNYMESESNNVVWADFEMGTKFSVIAQTNERASVA